MAFLALVFAMGGFAIAANETATTSAKKQIKACYSKKTGDLRVKKAGKACRKGEKKIAWNKRGVRGLKGKAGAQGQKGDTGAPGPTGAQGPAGTGGGGGGVTLGPGTVGTEHLADGSITAAKLAQNLITDNLLGLVYEHEASGPNGDAIKTATANCPAGTRLVGGGGGPTDSFLAPLSNNALVTTYNGPAALANAWRVNAFEVLPFGSWALSSYAICIRD